MGQSERNFAVASNQMRGNGFQHGAMDCTDAPTIPVRAARGIWPEKTAENWAYHAGVQPRMAKYWLSGHKVSDAGRLALIRLLT
jgi:hypothetical protein